MVQPTIKALLVDDDADFRASVSPTLARRGFALSEVADGGAALAAIEVDRPDVVLLDLKMPGMSGIETLQRLRQIDGSLPVVILTGHGNPEDALEGIHLGIVDFVQKPVDVELLARRVRLLLDLTESARQLRERTIREVMVASWNYPRLYADQPVEEAFESLRQAFFEPSASEPLIPGVRSALVFDRDKRFVGLLRFSDLLKLLIDERLIGAPQDAIGRGMFLAQSKVIGKRTIEDLMGEPVSVEVDAPLIEAVRRMVAHHVISLPVMDGDRLVGVLRERDIVLEVAMNLGTL